MFRLEWSIILSDNLRLTSTVLYLHDIVRSILHHVDVLSFFVCFNVNLSRSLFAENADLVTKFPGKLILKLFFKDVVSLSRFRPA